MASIIKASINLSNVPKDKIITGKKGKKLYLPLRKNLTGKESGPEMNLILTLLGREKIIKRLK